MIDLHCHPSLKTYLFNNSQFNVKLNEKQKTTSGINILSLQTNIPDMKAGGVKAAITAHYIPELGIIRESSLLNASVEILKLFWKDLVEKVENSDEQQTTYEQTLSSIRIFEEQIEAAQKGGANTAIAKSFDELQKYLSENRITFLHSVEGGHSLGRNLKSEDYLERLDDLFHKGVCLLTIGHFFDNDFVKATVGIPPQQRILFNKDTEPDLSEPITPAGEEVVRWMIEKGMLIDLVHTTPSARKRILQINKESGSNMRPMVYSHAGVQDLFVNDKYPGDRFYNPDKDEILSVKESNGIIGIIFMNYWLSGKDEKIFTNDPGTQLVFETIKYIHTLTGTYDNIAIGSDFDAINNPSDDLYNHSLVNKLRELLWDNGIAENDIEKIMTTNALRVLQNGWGS